VIAPGTGALGRTKSLGMIDPAQPPVAQLLAATV
jgi:hypothetical protein